MNKILIAVTTKDIRVMSRLSRDENEYVRSRVLLNPNCPIKLIKRLCEDESNWVIQNILINSKCDEEILKLIRKNKIAKEYITFLN